MAVDRCIITPTYPGHFPCIPKYLESFQTHVRDRDFPVHFIVSREDRRDFETLIAPYRNLNLTVLTLEDILARFGVRTSPGVLLDKYGKFSFQSLKKWYAILAVAPRQCLLLDSESMWVNDTDMAALFDEYFADPFLAFSSIDARRRAVPLLLDVVKNNDYLLHTGGDKWFLEHFCWFYDTRVLQDLCGELGSPLDIVDALYKSPTLDWSLFETLLYHEYIFHRNERYGYRLVDADEALRQALGDEKCAAYLDRFYKRFQGNAGILEYAATVINRDDAEQVARIFADNHFRIVRCEFPEGNYEAQKIFMDRVRPSICAVSQGHVFGLNQGRTNRMLDAIPDVDLTALRRHAAAFAAPARTAAGWLREGLQTSWHGSEALFKGLRHEWRTRRSGRNGHS